MKDGDKRCPAMLRMLQPRQDTDAALAQQGVSKYAVWKSIEWHAESHGACFLQPEVCLHFPTPTALMEREKEMLEGAGMSVHRRKKMPKLPEKIREAITSHSLSQAAQPPNVVMQAVGGDHVAASAAAADWFAASRAPTLAQLVRRSRSCADIVTTDDLSELLLPLTVRPPSMELFQVWVYKQDLSGDPAGHYYAWTTNRMLESVHLWLQANEQAVENRGKVFVSFDGDYDVIGGKAAKRQTRFHKFGDTTGEDKGDDGDDNADDKAPPSRRRRLMAHPSNHMDRGGRHPVGCGDEVNETSWVHMFVCTERNRQEKRLGYVLSATPFCGIVARSENSPVIVQSALRALELVAETYTYEAIDVEGVRSDNGPGARAAAELLLGGSFPLVPTILPCR